MTFSLDLKLGAANEVVKILIDGKLVRVRGTTAQSGCRDARHGHSVGGNCIIHARRDDRSSTATAGRTTTAPIRGRWAVATRSRRLPKLLFRASGNAGNRQRRSRLRDRRPRPLSSNVRVTKRDC